VVEDAFIQRNFDVLARWHTLLAAYLFMSFDEEENSKHMAIPSFAHVRRRFYQIEAHTVLLPDYGFLRRPPPNQVDSSAFLTWWFQDR
jgi:hypothetical protein